MILFPKATRKDRSPLFPAYLVEGRIDWASGEAKKFLEADRWKEKFLLPKQRLINRDPGIS